jgi:phenylacetate-CoA ligase
VRPYQIIELAGILRAQRFGPERLERLQTAKLRRMLRHAHSHVPYVRRMLDELRLRPEDFRRVEDLRRLPLLDKAAFRAMPLEERSADDIPAESCRTFQTSGTTGRPLLFRLTRTDFTRRNFASARAYLASGYRPWQRMGVPAADRVANGRRSWNEKLGLWRRREVSSWQDPERWLAELAAWKPHVLIGRVSTLLILAEAAAKRDARALSPRLVFASAEILDPASRGRLSSAFSCPVLDFYLSFEGGCLAWECPACGGYHMSADMVILEILDRDGRPVAPGEEGEVVITNLHSAAMPLIRYRQGDTAVLSAKSPRCGRGLPLLESIQGRKDDVIVLRSGRRIPPATVHYVFIPVPGIRRWQVVQTALDRLEIRVEPGPGFDDAARRRLREEMMKLLREDVVIDILEGPEIARNPAAKARPIISLVTSGERSW